MKKILLPIILASLMANAYALSPTASSGQNQITSAQSQLELAEQNKKIVIDFYNGVFIKHQVQAYSDRYVVDQYIQHNPFIPDGKAPFVNFFVDYFKKNPEAKNTIKSVIAEGDRVVLHVHSTENAKDRGKSIVDIFRLENGKIVEHWDVQQDIPKKSANNHTMF